MATKITYTVTEAAELLGISRSSAYECVRRGEIPSLTLGRRVVIPRRAFEALLDGADGGHHLALRVGCIATNSERCLTKRSAE